MYYTSFFSFTGSLFQATGYKVVETGKTTAKVIIDYAETAPLLLNSVCHLHCLRAALTHISSLGLRTLRYTYTALGYIHAYMQRDCTRDLRFTQRLPPRIPSDYFKEVWIKQGKIRSHAATNKYLAVLDFPNVSLFCLQIRVVRYLVSHGVQSSRISVLTPYSAQRAKITRALQAQMNSCASEVLSVFASQGTCVGLL